MLFFLYFIFFTVAFLEESLAQECNRCPGGFSYYAAAGKCYRSFSSKLNWQGAARVCSGYNSHLVAIRGINDILALGLEIESKTDSCINQFVGGPAFWTSGRRNCPNDSFFWRVGLGAQLDVDFTNWLHGEPNDLGGNEDCIHFLVRDDAPNLEWNDTPCSTVNCFVCEIDVGSPLT